MNRFTYTHDPAFYREVKAQPGLKRARDELASTYRRLRRKGEGKMARLLFRKLRAAKAELKAQMLSAAFYQEPFS